MLRLLLFMQTLEAYYAAQRIRRTAMCESRERPRILLLILNLTVIRKVGNKL
jgi:hypothetical protein